MLENTINETQREIKRWLDKLDEFVIAMEATWGIGNLHNFVSEATAEKMERQDKKLAEAILAQDIKSVQDLVQGTIRGWAVMEKEAISRGHKPIAPEFFEVRLESGFHLRIAKNNSQASVCVEKGVYVWTLEEVARVIEKDYTLVNKIKDHFPEAKLKSLAQDFDFKKGDDLPEF